MGFLQLFSASNTFTLSTATTTMTTAAAAAAATAMATAMATTMATTTTTTVVLTVAAKVFCEEIACDFHIQERADLGHAPI